MVESISERASRILRILADGEEHGRAYIETTANASRATINRELSALVSAGLVTTSGSARATSYRITAAGRMQLTYDLDAYRQRQPEERAHFTSLQPAFFDLIEGSIPPAVLARFGVVRDQPAERRGMAATAAARRELERFVTEFAWKSSAIEGNTYSVVETELLLSEGKPAHGPPSSRQR